VVGGAGARRIGRRPSHDIDLATQRTPEQVTKRCGGRYSRRCRTGSTMHGDRSLGERSFELTTLRRDVKPDGRPTRSCSLHRTGEDAARRDFNINAMSMVTLDGEVFAFSAASTTSGGNWAVPSAIRRHAALRINWHPCAIYAFSRDIAVRPRARIWRRSVPARRVLETCLLNGSGASWRQQFGG